MTAKELIKKLEYALDCAKTLNHSNDLEVCVQSRHSNVEDAAFWDWFDIRLTGKNTVVNLSINPLCKYPHCRAQERVKELEKKLQALNTDKLWP